MSEKKIKIAFLATDGYEDLELHYPRIRLIEAGFATELISLHRREIKGKHGYPIKPDKLIREANPDDYDGIIIPGGTKNPDYLRRDKDVLDFVAKIDEDGKLVGAICHAGWMLASADILKHRTVTAFFAIKDDLVHAGANYVDQEVVVDGKLITSRKPDDLPAFMREIIAALRAGMLDRVLNSNTVWLCTSCYSCYVRCPAGIPYTDVMYELMSQTTAPSWGAQIARGATTVWETWDGDPERELSRNMKMFCSTEVFFFRTLAGVTTAHRPLFLKQRRLKLNRLRPNQMSVKCPIPPPRKVIPVSGIILTANSGLNTPPVNRLMYLRLAPK